MSYAGKKKKAGRKKNTNQRSQVLRALAKGRKTKKMLEDLTGIEKHQVFRILKELKEKNLIKTTTKASNLKVNTRATIWKLKAKNPHAIQTINEITGLKLKVKPHSARYKHKVDLLKLILEYPRTQKEILKKTGMPTPIFYRILKSLKEKGLITQLPNKKGRKWASSVSIAPFKMNEVIEKYPEVKDQPKIGLKKEKIKSGKKVVEEKPRDLSPVEQTFADRMAAIRQKAAEKKSRKRKIEL